MEVEKYKDDYPEKNLRERKWFSVEEAAEIIFFPEVADMIKKLQAKMKRG